jgi:hypothetical protein
MLGGDKKRRNAENTGQWQKCDANGECRFAGWRAEGGWFGGEGVLERAY